MAIDLSATISEPTYSRLVMLWMNGTLPPKPSRTLLELWSADTPASVKQADATNSLLSLLASYAPALNRAADLAAENSHLGEREILELAGLPLSLPS